MDRIAAPTDGMVLPLNCLATFSLFSKGAFLSALKSSDEQTANYSACATKRATIFARDFGKFGLKSSDSGCVEDKSKNRTAKKSAITTKHTCYRRNK